MLLTFFIEETTVSAYIGESGRFGVGMFWVLGCFEAWNVLEWGRFEVGTFWGFGHFETGTF